MRLILVKILFLFSINSIAQWDLVYTNDSLACRDIHFFNADTGIIIGTHTYNNSDFIMKTFNGGQSWDTTYLNNVLLWTIDFPSRDTGYIAFANPFQVNVMRTIDGGNSWQQTTNNLLVGNTKMDIKFFNNNIGILSMGGYSWKTIDAGVNWSLISNNPMGGGQEIFIEDSVLIGGGNSSIMYYSFDTSATYDTVMFCNNGNSSAFFLKDGSINICGRGQDGASWGYGHINYGTIILSDIQNMQFTTIHFPYPQMYTITDIVRTDSYYYAVGYPFNATIGSHFLKSTDGINWFRQESSEPGGVQISLIERIFCMNDTLCYAYGGGRIYKTTNGGGVMLQQAGVLVNDVDEIESEKSFSVYPNPFTNSFSISSEEIMKSVKVFDLTGKFIFETKPNSSETIVELKVSNGVYFIEVTSETKIKIKKIIKI